MKKKIVSSTLGCEYKISSLCAEAVVAKIYLFRTTLLYTNDRWMLRLQGLPFKMAALLHHAHISPLKSFMNSCFYSLTRDFVRKVTPGANCYCLGNKHISYSARCGIHKKYSDNNDENESQTVENESSHTSLTGDYFGINEYNARTKNTTVEEDSPTNESRYKYENTQSTNRKVVKTSYGFVRFDQENKILENTSKSLKIRRNARIQKERVSHKEQKMRTVVENHPTSNFNVIDDQYFNLPAKHNKVKNTGNRQHIPEVSAWTSDGNLDDMPTNYIEQQYFPSNDKVSSSHSRNDGEEAINYRDQKPLEDKKDMNYFDQQLFSDNRNEQSKQSSTQESPEDAVSVSSSSISDMNSIEEQYFKTHGSEYSIQSTESVDRSESIHDYETTETPVEADNDMNYFDQQLFSDSRNKQPKEQSTQNSPQTSKAGDRNYFGQHQQDVFKPDPKKSDGARVGKSGKISKRETTSHTKDSDDKNLGLQEAFHVAMDIRKQIRETNGNFYFYIG